MILVRVMVMVAIPDCLRGGAGTFARLSEGVNTVTLAGQKNKETK